jgi:predicted acylesterase/phospholipase RssA
MSGLTDLLRLPLGIVGRPSRNGNGKKSGTHAKAQSSTGKPNALASGVKPAPSNGTRADDLDLQRWPYFVGSAGERDKIALVLAGGGITGAFYEIGALRAIDDLLVGLSVNDFDIYVGTSAGALINSLIASGFNPREVMQAINNKHPELHGLRYGDAFRLNIEETVRRLTTLPGALWSIGNTLVRNAGEVAMADLLWEMARVLPAGIYNGDSLERYVRASLETQGRPNSFAQMEKELYIVASELDSGARAVFGRGQIEDVPISRAVAASSAVPVLYRPVQIHERDYLDGGLHGAASLDLAIEAGAKMVVCINPMVPFDASNLRPNEHYIRQHGLQAVINQSLRTLLHSSLRYHIKNLRVKYPDVDIILIQPGLDDYEMFSRSPMHYSGRLAVAQHGFESVTMGLLRNRDYYASVMARHGIRLHTDLLEAELAALQQSGGDFQVVEEVIEPHAGHQTLSASIGHLEVRLKQLEQYVEMAKKRRNTETEDHPIAGRTGA